MNENIFPFDESLISAYLDGELSDQEKYEVESAIRNTPALQTLVKELSAVRSLVASTALKMEKPSRSLQSSEWLKPSINSPVSTVDVLSKTPSSQRGAERNRLRFSLGLLGSLAAIILIFVTTKLLIEAQPDSGMQIVMEGNSPGSSAAALPQMKSSGPQENPDFPVEDGVPAAPALAQDVMKSDSEVTAPPFSAELKTMPPPVDPRMAVSAVPKLSSEAREFLVFLEQKLNSESDTKEANRWRFKTENELNKDVIVDSTVRGRSNSGDESIKDVTVEYGQTIDEIILQVTAEEAEAILKLGNIGSELIDEVSLDQELLAIATLSITEGKQNKVARSSNAQATELLTDDRARKWTIDFTPQTANSVAGFAGGAMAGAGGGGSDPNVDSQRNLSNTTNAADLSPKVGAMRSIDRFANQSSSSSKDSQLNPEQSSQATQPADSTKKTTDAASVASASEKTSSKAKIMRIRIKIKKEPSSSGSNE